jgi:hypothetical protein
MKLDLDKAITQEIAKMLTVGFEYQSEYGVQVKEAALTPIIKQWLSANKEEILAEVIKQIGKKKLQTMIVDSLTKEITSDNYWNSYKWKELAKDTAPLIADRVAKQMYEEHKKDVCKSETELIK